MSKPFVARGSRVQRCESCLLSERVCICSFKTSYTAKARFFLMMHHKEGFKPTNTGRLIEDCIQGTERFKWSRTEPDESFLAAVSSPDVDPYIVFPEGEGYEDRMVDYQPKEGKQPVFIILDGTWRQARRMFRHSRYLDALPVIQPVVESSSAYRLRKAAVEGQLCTAEVAAEMLRLVHDKKGSELLSAYFRIFNEHYRASRLTRPIADDTSDKTLIREWQRL
ncbi:tRNA-uridine aminocarboxypropyltransferase [Neptuniibacter sp.]|uniref:tRNA-uridine aminocarboxypropyltransferase n=1 Tax=Neptuniibacter sp. TaxID=1962643 RepID=UPI0026151970|nr:DTW domain-containing protein [Neptuniibacter sp.]MCP4595708.1 DTW domain-containing protein [Neptuniibacter sp.]